MSHLSRMKTPDLPYLSVAAALRAYVLRPASLDVSATLGTTASFSGLSRPGFTTSQLCLANCLSCLIVSHILTIPYVLSLVLTIAIYAMPPPPLRPIEGVRGIHPSTTVVLSERDILYCIGYLLCLGPSQALSKGHHSVERRQENRGSRSRLPGIQQLTASDRMLRGRLPQELGGAVYLLVRSSI